MKIIADRQIPLLETLFAPVADLVLKSAHEFTRDNLKDAEILLVRSVTKVNASLIEGTAIKFIGSASAGFDHIDIDWLTQHKITWKHAPGSNAIAVGEYVLCCLAALFSDGILSQKPLRAGIIGVGNTGSQTLQHFSALGFDVICNDPPRALREPNFYSHALDELHECDLICIHTPLVKEGEFSTYHLINEDFLNALKPGCVILNASRGEVIDTRAILKYDSVHYCFDVWPHEPNIDLEILKRCLIATPHIAGHSIEAKLRASVQLYQQIQKIYSWPELPPQWQSLLAPDPFELWQWLKRDSWQEQLLKFFNPKKLTQTMQENLLKNPNDVAALFTELRASHKRHELKFYF